MDVRNISVAQYQNLRAVFLAVLEEHLGGRIPVKEPQELQIPCGGISEAHYRWLKMLDSSASPERFRLGIEKRRPEATLLITVLDFLRSEPRPVDDDRFDWLITYLFKLRREHGECGENIGAQILETLPDLSQGPLSDAGRQYLTRIAGLLQRINSYKSRAQLNRSGVIAEGRRLKAAFGEERYHPVVLSVLVNYNLAAGKAFAGLPDESVLEENVDADAPPLELASFNQEAGASDDAVGGASEVLTHALSTSFD